MISVAREETLADLILYLAICRLRNLNSIRRRHRCPRKPDRPHLRSPRHHPATDTRTNLLGRIHTRQLRMGDVVIHVEERVGVEHDDDPVGCSVWTGTVAGDGVDGAGERGGYDQGGWEHDVAGR